MKADVEQLLREGLDRRAAGVQVPAGLADRVRRYNRRRRLMAGSAIGGGIATITAAAVIAAIGAAAGPGGQAGTHAAPRAQTAAFVVSRVERALVGQHLVFRGRTTARPGEPTISWAYGPRNRLEEFTGSGCGHVLPNGSCTHRGGSEPALAQGTALISGKLTGVYVTYFDRKWSLSPESVPASACSTTGALEAGGPIPTSNWPAFIHATLACGAAAVTGHVRIDGAETTKITGSPVTVKLRANYAKLIHERWVRAQWTLYVNPATYLPVRMSSSAQEFGGPAASTHSASVTDIQWLRPTPANIAKALVTIPAGFHQVSSAADQ